ncbi:unnamed protein product [Cuscuta campestris]|uniref:Retrotransposon Copia-like N-terminal domain-containing protein n=1 Tax=Cuscuta campestris TaxID=132261 RepID=A0A484MQD7_9ASTE|nr:unnamed protein product [Cuscuta campestris]
MAARMLFWLTTLNLARYLREDPPIVGETADEPTVQAKEAWIANNYTCLNLILNCLSDALYAVYRRAASTKELWTTLSNKYQAEDAGAKKFVVDKVLDFKMVDSKPVVSQAEELILIFNECTDEGMGVSEAFQVAAIIHILLSLRLHLFVFDFLIRLLLVDLEHLQTRHRCEVNKLRLIGYRIRERIACTNFSVLYFFGLNTLNVYNPAV